MIMQNMPGAPHEQFDGPMSAPLAIHIPFAHLRDATLRAGRRVLLNGVMLTARDAAHQRLVALLREGKPLPLDLQDQVIYYAGPAPARPGRPVGPVGPTTSYRMDAFAPELLDAGVRGMVGKGERGAAVIAAMRRTGSVYFAAVGGAAALLSRCVTACETVAFEDLGAEAIRCLTVRDFPAIVAIDALGESIYERNGAI